MKRFLNTLVALALGVFALAACQPNIEIEPKLELDNVKLNISKIASETQVMVYANGSWEASLSENVDWLTIKDGKGNGDGYFTIEWLENPSVARVAEISVRSGNLTKTISVAQEGYISEIKLSFVSGEQHYIALGGPYKSALEQNLGELLADVKKEVIYKDANGTVITPSEEWISDIQVSDDFVAYTIAPNHTGDNRFAILKLSIEFPSIKQMNGTTETVIFEGGEYSTELSITQGLEAGNMSFDKDAVDISSHGGELSIPWTADLGGFFDEIKSSVSYDGNDSGWITNIKASNESVNFTAEANNSRADRSAIIKLVFEHGGFSLSANLKVNQIKRENELSMTDLRAMLSSAGSVELDGDYINAIIIADGGNLNMATNDQITPSLIDYETSLTTNYVESTDGKYGLRIRTLTPEDNNALKAGNSVKISLGGLTLTREDNPTRYTLSGLSSTAVGGAQAVGLPSKLKAINELTDDDIYTFVSIKDVEIAIPFGSFNNVPKGKGNDNDSLCDYAARFLRNADGDMISMLVNGSTPWRFIDKDVPAGSGNVNAVVVYDELLRAADHKGIGSKYQVRPLNLSDIALDETNSFSSTLITWYFPNGNKTWDPDYLMTGYSGKLYRVKSNDGNGWIDCKGATGFQQSSSYIDVSKVSWEGASSKCIRYNTTTLWDPAKGEAGTHFDISFPTADVPAGKNLTLVMNAMTANTLAMVTVSPVNYIFSYSIDGGKTFTDLVTRQIFPYSRYDFKHITLPGGPTELVIPLPDAAAGKSQVIVRFKAANEYCVNAGTGMFDGQFSSVQTYMRFAAIAVKYNK